MTILLSILVFLSIVNLILLVVLGAFLVQFRQRVNGIFADLTNVLEQLFGSLPEPSYEPSEKKTWDEKYEEEIEMRERLRREQSGLQDLSEQAELSWGVPPAPNPQNAKGLTIIDKGRGENLNDFAGQSNIK